MAEMTSFDHIGFLTVFQEGAGYVGGYLITNLWGRPIEFRLTTAIQPNKVQQILYGSSIQEYLHSEVIGKTLIEKSQQRVDLVVVDHPDSLGIARHTGIPTVAIMQGGAAVETELTRFQHARAADELAVDHSQTTNLETIIAIMNRLDAALELQEPFTRIREAMQEARKLGVNNRAA
ncbi:MAG: hypothetical protein R3B84_09590 [Zavarzinella sp.]